MWKHLLSITFLCFLLFSNHLEGQNLFPNPGFESYSTCPTGFGQVIRCTDYDQPSSGSSDYWNCGSYGNSAAIIGTPNSGTGVMAMWSGPNRPSCPGSAEAELIRTTLLSPLVPTKTYAVTIHLMIDNIGGGGTFTDNPNDCTDYGVYFYDSANPPPFADPCCISRPADFLVPGSSVLKGTYTAFSGTFTASSPLDQVVFGPFCNGNTSTCDESNKVYFNLDDVEIIETTPLSASMVSFTHEVTRNENVLHWDLEQIQSEIDRIEVLRAEDGEVFKTIEILSQPPLSGSFVDLFPIQLIQYYQLKMTNKEGQLSFTQIIELKRGEMPDYQIVAYPGWDREQFLIDFHAHEMGTSRLYVHDIKGNLVFSDKFALTAGKNQLRAKVPAQVSGLLFLTLIDPVGRKYNGKIIQR